MRGRSTVRLTKGIAEPNAKKTCPLFRQSRSIQLQWKDVHDTDTVVDIRVRDCT